MTDYRKVSEAIRQVKLMLMDKDEKYNQKLILKLWEMELMDVPDAEKKQETRWRSAD